MAVEDLVDPAADLLGLSLKYARAIPPAMQAIMSLSPPSEVAFRTASSKSSGSKNAPTACGTLPWHETLKS